jgi:hypothetical protein
MPAGCPCCGSEECWFAGDRARVRDQTLWEVRQAIANDLDARHFPTVAFGELDRMLDRLAAPLSPGPAVPPVTMPAMTTPPDDQPPKETTPPPDTKPKETTPEPETKAPPYTPDE